MVTIEHFGAHERLRERAVGAANGCLRQQFQIASLSSIYAGREVYRSADPERAEFASNQGPVFIVDFDRPCALERALH